jgi:hypothetical protein
MHPRGQDIANRHRSSLSDPLSSYIHKTPYDIRITVLELQVAAGYVIRIVVLKLQLAGYICTLCQG